jgi:hypothetical protein
MEEFNNLKMEYAFMKADLLIYQEKSKRSQAKQWEFYREQVDEIFGRRLNLTEKIRRCISCTWRPINK